MSETSETHEPTTTTQTPSEPEAAERPAHVDESCAKAPINKKWFYKLLIIAIFFVGFGAYGLYDAVVAYPARGERFAEWAKWQYLEAAKAANAEDFGVFERESSVRNPVEELAALKERRSSGLGSSSQLRGTMLDTRYEWLNGLKTIGQLDPERTTIEFPQDELDRLRAEWTSATSNPSPLKSYDIPSQWVIMVVCWFIGGWMLLHMLRVMAQRIAWDAPSKTITLPGPISVSASQVDEFDKRKWDKFIVFLKLKDAHPTHGGQEIKVDTYQHALVEDWILEMERASESGSGASQ